MSHLPRDPINFSDMKKSHDPHDQPAEPRPVNQPNEFTESKDPKPSSSPKPLEPELSQQYPVQPSNNGRPSHGRSTVDGGLLLNLSPRLKDNSSESSGIDDVTSPITLVESTTLVNELGEKSLQADELSDPHSEFVPSAGEQAFHRSPPSPMLNDPVHQSRFELPNFPSDQSKVARLPPTAIIGPSQSPTTFPDRSANSSPTREQLIPVQPNTRRSVHELLQRYEERASTSVHPGQPTAVLDNFPPEGASFATNLSSNDSSSSRSGTPLRGTDSKKPTRSPPFSSTFTSPPVLRDSQSQAVALEATPELGGPFGEKALSIDRSDRLPSSPGVQPIQDLYDIAPELHSPEGFSDDAIGNRPYKESLSTKSNESPLKSETAPGRLYAPEALISRDMSISSQDSVVTSSSSAGDDGSALPSASARVVNSSFAGDRSLVPRASPAIDHDPTHHTPLTYSTSFSPTEVKTITQSTEEDPSIHSDIHSVIVREFDSGDECSVPSQLEESNIEFNQSSQVQSPSVSASEVGSPNLATQTSQQRQDFFGESLSYEANFGHHARDLQSEYQPLAHEEAIIKELAESSFGSPKVPVPLPSEVVTETPNHPLAQSSDFWTTGSDAVHQPLESTIEDLPATTPEVNPDPSDAVIEAPATESTDKDETTDPTVEKASEGSPDNSFEAEITPPQPAATHQETTLPSRASARESEESADNEDLTADPIIEMVAEEYPNRPTEAEFAAPEPGTTHEEASVLPDAEEKQFFKDGATTHSINEKNFDSFSDPLVEAESDMALEEKAESERPTFCSIVENAFESSEVRNSTPTVSIVVEEASAPSHTSTVELEEKAGSGSPAAIDQVIDRVFENPSPSQPVQPDDLVIAAAEPPCDSQGSFSFQAEQGDHPTEEVLDTKHEANPDDISSNQVLDAEPGDKSDTITFNQDPGKNENGSSTTSAQSEDIFNASYTCSNLNSQPTESSIQAQGEVDALAATMHVDTEAKEVSLDNIIESQQLTQAEGNDADSPLDQVTTEEPLALPVAPELPKDEDSIIPCEDTADASQSSPTAVADRIVESQQQTQAEGNDPHVVSDQVVREEPLALSPAPEDPKDVAFIIPYEDPANAPQSSPTAVADRIVETQQSTQAEGNDANVKSVQIAMEEPLALSLAPEEPNDEASIIPNEGPVNLSQSSLTAVPDAPSIPNESPKGDSGQSLTEADAPPNIATAEDQESPTNHPGTLAHFSAEVFPHNLGSVFDSPTGSGSPEDEAGLNTEKTADISDPAPEKPQAETLKASEPSLPTEPSPPAEPQGDVDGSTSAGEDASEAASQVLQAIVPKIDSLSDSPAEPGNAEDDAAPLAEKTIDISEPAPQELEAENLKAPEPSSPTEPSPPTESQGDTAGQAAEISESAPEETEAENLTAPEASLPMEPNSPAESQGDAAGQSAEVSQTALEEPDAETLTAPQVSSPMDPSPPAESEGDVAVPTVAVGKTPDAASEESEAIPVESDVSGKEAGLPTEKVAEISELASEEPEAEALKVPEPSSPTKSAPAESPGDKAGPTVAGENNLEAAPLAPEATASDSPAGPTNAEDEAGLDTQKTAAAIHELFEGHAVAPDKVTIPTDATSNGDGENAGKEPESNALKIDPVSDSPVEPGNAEEQADLSPEKTADIPQPAPEELQTETLAAFTAAGENIPEAASQESKAAVPHPRSVSNSLAEPDHSPKDEAGLCIEKTAGKSEPAPEEPEGDTSKALEPSSPTQPSPPAESDGDAAGPTVAVENISEAAPEQPEATASNPDPVSDFPAESGDAGEEAGLSDAKATDISEPAPVEPEAETSGVPEPSLPSEPSPPVEFQVVMASQTPDIPQPTPEPEAEHFQAPEASLPMEPSPPAESQGDAPGQTVELCEPAPEEPESETRTAPQPSLVLESSLPAESEGDAAGLTVAAANTPEAASQEPEAPAPKVDLTSDSPAEPGDAEEEARFSAEHQDDIPQPAPVEPEAEISKLPEPPSPMEPSQPAEPEGDVASPAAVGENAPEAASQEPEPTASILDSAGDSPAEPGNAEQQAALPIENTADIPEPAPEDPAAETSKELEPSSPSESSAAIESDGDVAGPTVAGQNAPEAASQEPEPTAPQVDPVPQSPVEPGNTEVHTGLSTEERAEIPEPAPEESEGETSKAPEPLSPTEPSPPADPQGDVDGSTSAVEDAPEAASVELEAIVPKMDLVPDSPAGPGNAEAQAERSTDDTPDTRASSENQATNALVGEKPERPVQGDQYEPQPMYNTQAAANCVASHEVPIPADATSNADGENAEKEPETPVPKIDSISDSPTEPSNAEEEARVPDEKPAESSEPAPEEPVAETTKASELSSPTESILPADSPGDAPGPIAAGENIAEAVSQETEATASDSPVEPGNAEAQAGLPTENTGDIQDEAVEPDTAQSPANVTSDRGGENAGKEPEATAPKIDSVPVPAAGPGNAEELVGVPVENIADVFKPAPEELEAETVKAPEPSLPAEPSAPTESQGDAIVETADTSEPAQEESEMEILRTSETSLPVEPSTSAETQDDVNDLSVAGENTPMPGSQHPEATSPNLGAVSDSPAEAGNPEDEAALSTGNTADISEPAPEEPEGENLKSTQPSLPNEPSPPAQSEGEVAGPTVSAEDTREAASQESEATAPSAGSASVSPAQPDNAAEHAGLSTDQTADIRESEVASEQPSPPEPSPPAESDDVAGPTVAVENTPQAASEEPEATPCNPDPVSDSAAEPGHPEDQAGLSAEKTAETTEPAPEEPEGQTQKAPEPSSTTEPSPPAESPGDVAADAGDDAPEIASQEPELTASILDSASDIPAEPSNAGEQVTLCTDNAADIHENLPAPEETSGQAAAPVKVPIPADATATGDGENAGKEPELSTPKSDSAPHSPAEAGNAEEEAGRSTDKTADTAEQAPEELEKETLKTSEPFSPTELSPPAKSEGDVTAPTSVPDSPTVPGNAEEQAELSAEQPAETPKAAPQEPEAGTLKALELSSPMDTSPSAESPAAGPTVAADNTSEAAPQDPETNVPNLASVSEPPLEPDNPEDQAGLSTENTADPSEQVTAKAEAETSEGGESSLPTEPSPTAESQGDGFGQTANPNHEAGFCIENIADPSEQAPEKPEAETWEGEESSSPTEPSPPAESQGDLVGETANTSEPAPEEPEGETLKAPEPSSPTEPSPTPESCGDIASPTVGSENTAAAASQEAVPPVDSVSDSPTVSGNADGEAVHVAEKTVDPSDPVAEEPEAETLKAPEPPLPADPSPPAESQSDPTADGEIIPEATSQEPDVTAPKSDLVADPPVEPDHTGDAAQPSAEKPAEISESAPEEPQAETLKEPELPSPPEPSAAAESEGDVAGPPLAVDTSPEAASEEADVTSSNPATVSDSPAEPGEAEKQVGLSAGRTAGISEPPPGEPEAETLKASEQSLPTESSPPAESLAEKPIDPSDPVTEELEGETLKAPEPPLPADPSPPAESECDPTPDGENIAEATSQEPDTTAPKSDLVADPPVEPDHTGEEAEPSADDSAEISESVPEEPQSEDLKEPEPSSPPEPSAPVESEGDVAGPPLAVETSPEAASEEPEATPPNPDSVSRSTPEPGKAEEQAGPSAENTVETTEPAPEEPEGETFKAPEPSSTSELSPAAESPGDVAAVAGDNPPETASQEPEPSASKIDAGSDIDAESGNAEEQATLFTHNTANIQENSTVPAESPGQAIEPDKVTTPADATSNGDDENVQKDPEPTAPKVDSVPDSPAEPGSVEEEAGRSTEKMVDVAGPPPEEPGEETLKASEPSSTTQPSPAAESSGDVADPTVANESIPEAALQEPVAPIDTVSDFPAEPGNAQVETVLSAEGTADTSDPVPEESEGETSKAPEPPLPTDSSPPAESQSDPTADGENIPEATSQEPDTTAPKTDLVADCPVEPDHTGEEAGASAEDSAEISEPVPEEPQAETPKPESSLPPEPSAAAESEGDVADPPLAVETSPEAASEEPEAKVSDSPAEPGETEEQATLSAGKTVDISEPAPGEPEAETLQATEPSLPAESSPPAESLAEKTVGPSDPVAEEPEAETSKAPEPPLPTDASPPAESQCDPTPDGENIPEATSQEPDTTAPKSGLVADCPVEPDHNGEESGASAENSAEVSESVPEEPPAETLKEPEPSSPLDPSAPAESEGDVAGPPLAVETSPEAASEEPKAIPNPDPVSDSVAEPGHPEGQAGLSAENNVETTEPAPEEPEGENPKAPEPSPPTEPSPPAESPGDVAAVAGDGTPETASPEPEPTAPKIDSGSEIDAEPGSAEEQVARSTDNTANIQEEPSDRSAAPDKTPISPDVSANADGENENKEPESTAPKTDSVSNSPAELDKAEEAGILTEKTADIPEPVEASEPAPQEPEAEMLKASELSSPMETSPNAEPPAAGPTAAVDNTLEVASQDPQATVPNLASVPESPAEPDNPGDQAGLSTKNTADPSEQGTEKAEAETSEAGESSLPTDCPPAESQDDGFGQTASKDEAGLCTENTVDPSEQAPEKPGADISQGAESSLPTEPSPPAESQGHAGGQTATTSEPAPEESEGETSKAPEPSPPTEPSPTAESPGDVAAVAGDGTSETASPEPAPTASQVDPGSDIDAEPGNAEEQVARSTDDTANIHENPIAPQESSGQAVAPDKVPIPDDATANGDGDNVEKEPEATAPKMDSVVDSPTQPDDGEQEAGHSTGNTADITEPTLEEPEAETTKALESSSLTEPSPPAESEGDVAGPTSVSDSPAEPGNAEEQAADKAADMPQPAPEALEAEPKASEAEALKSSEHSSPMEPSPPAESHSTGTAAGESTPEAASQEPEVTVPNAGSASNSLAEPGNPEDEAGLSTEKTADISEPAPEEPEADTSKAPEPSSPTQPSPPAESESDVAAPPLAVETTPEAAPEEPEATVLNPGSVSNPLAEPGNAKDDTGLSTEKIADISEPAPEDPEGDTSKVPEPSSPTQPSPPAESEGDVAGPPPTVETTTEAASEEPDATSSNPAPVSDSPGEDEEQAELSAAKTADISEPAPGEPEAEASTPEQSLPTVSSPPTESPGDVPGPTVAGENIEEDASQGAEATAPRTDIVSESSAEPGNAEQEAGLSAEKTAEMSEPAPQDLEAEVLKEPEPSSPNEPGPPAESPGVVDPVVAGEDTLEAASQELEATAPSVGSVADSATEPGNNKEQAGLSAEKTADISEPAPEKPGAETLKASEPASPTSPPPTIYHSSSPAFLSSPTPSMTTTPRPLVDPAAIVKHHQIAPIVSNIQREIILPARMKKLSMISVDSSRSLFTKDLIYAFTFSGSESAVNKLKQDHVADHTTPNVPHQSSSAAPPHQADTDDEFSPTIHGGAKSFTAKHKLIKPHPSLKRSRSTDVRAQQRSSHRSGVSRNANNSFNPYNSIRRYRPKSLRLSEFGLQPSRRESRKARPEQNNDLGDSFALIERSDALTYSTEDDRYVNPTLSRRLSTSVKDIIHKRNNRGTLHLTSSPLDDIFIAEEFEFDVERELANLSPAPVKPEEDAHLLAQNRVQSSEADEEPRRSSHRHRGGARPGPSVRISVDSKPSTRGSCLSDDQNHRKHYRIRSKLTEVADKIAESLHHYPS